MKKRLFNQGKQFERLLKVERAAVNVEERTITLAFAGETPCERWYGTEILDCKKESIRLERLLTGGPLLLGHDADKQIGVVESVEIGEDKVCRAVVRFSRSALAEEILADVQDGIRGNVSVGYMIHDAILVRKDGDKEEWRITDWEPYEVSIVPMPADFKTAGVGRSAEEDPEHKPTEQENETMSDTIDIKAVQEKAAAEARALELKRVADIRAAGQQFADHDGPAIAERLAADPNGSVEQFRAEILAAIDAKMKATEKTRREGHVASVQVSERYTPQSLRAWQRHGVQKAEEMAHRAGQWARAVLCGDEAALRFCKDNGIETRVMNSITGSAGGFLVPDEMESGIIDLRAEYGVVRRLAQIYPMTGGTLTIPKWSAGTTAYFAGENTATTESDLTLGQVQLVGKELSALTRVSMNLLETSVIDLAAFLAEQQAYAFAVKEDACFIDGDGTSTYGGMKGLKAHLETSGMAGIYTSATNSDYPSEIILSELNGLMAKLPSYALSGAQFLCSPAYKQMILQRLAAAGGGNTMMTLADGTIGQGFLGYPVQVCEPCYSALATDLTGKAMLFFGNFKQGVAMGERRGVTIQVLRERYAEYRQVGILASEVIDIVNHGVGDTSNAGPIVALIAG